jgi:signal transduction histidine kinase
VTDAARAHAEQRFALRLSSSDMVAEYRALRASVIRHWLSDARCDDDRNCGELIRFNESIDQAVIESIACYNPLFNRMRDVFVGILVHDLRTPLDAINNSAQFSMGLDTLPEQPLRAAANILRSSHRARIMDDLVDFTRVRLDGSLPMKASNVNLEQVCGHVVAEIESLHPTQAVQLRMSGDLRGTWDATRLEELLINLLENAIDYGRAGGEIVVEAAGNEETVVMSVINEGDPIPSDRMRTLFDPLKRPDEKPAARRAGAGLGLGLFTAQEIASAHGATIAVTSSDVTRFAVTLPRTFVAFAK